MTTTKFQFPLSALALATTLLLAACGGGDASPPAAAVDTTPPTVAITDSVAGATASGDVTFTFTFSESVGATFTAADVTVAGGTKGTFTQVSTTSATLVVTPTANTAGTITVDVAAGAFADAAGNASTVAANASQAYNTVVAAVSGNTGTCTVAPCLDFTGATVSTADFGGAVGTLVADPVDATNQVLRIVKTGGSQFFAGSTVVTTISNNSVTAADFATSKIVTLRVYAPAVGKIMKVKFEDAADATHSVEADVLTTTANAWQTLTFDMANQATGTAAYNPAFTYNKVSIFPDFNSTPAADLTYYVDELKYTGVAGGGGGGGGGATVLTFSSGFAVGGRTVEAGAFGGYSGSNQDGFNCDGLPQHCGSGGTFTDTAAAAATGFFNYYQTPTPATALFVGIFLQAPGLTTGISGTASTPGLQLTNQTSMSFKFGQNPEWFNSGATNKFVVMLTLGKFLPGAVTPCNIKLAKVVTPTAAAASSYTLNLSDFFVTQNCGLSTLTVASALAQSPISQIDFQGAGGTIPITAGGVSSGANLSVPVGSPAVYPTTVVVNGGITFQ